MRRSSLLAIVLLALALFLIAAPAFADNPWTEKPGRGGANQLDGEWPWALGPGKRGGANQLDGEWPWIEGPPKHGANNQLSAFSLWLRMILGR